MYAVSEPPWLLLPGAPPHASPASMLQVERLRTLQSPMLPHSRIAQQVARSSSMLAPPKCGQVWRWSRVVRLIGDG